MRRRPLPGGWYGALKRGADACAALAGLVVLSPLLLLIAAAVRLLLGSPVLYRQTRPGFQGRPFTIVKFRTMTDARGADGAPLPDADRLTAFGRFLRLSSMDELPELWNVLVGDMSLVGPRPLLMSYLPLYNAEQSRRHDVRPGITGWTQVNGRNENTWERKFELDIWYVDHVSLAVDLRILALTVPAVLHASGVSHSGHATMEAFQGTPPDRPGR